MNNTQQENGPKSQLLNNLTGYELRQAKRLIQAVKELEKCGYPKGKAIDRLVHDLKEGGSSLTEEFIRGVLE